MILEGRIIAVLACGLVDKAINPSFLLTVAEAEEVVKSMADVQKQLERPVLEGSSIRWWRHTMWRGRCPI